LSGSSLNMNLCQLNGSPWLMGLMRRVSAAGTVSFFAAGTVYLPSVLVLHQ
jgi:hypothetical protein